MAHFRAEVKGSRSVASRLGTKNSGIETLLQTWGWNVRVVARYSVADEQDYGTIILVSAQTGVARHVADVNLTTGEVLPNV